MESNSPPDEPQGREGMKSSAVQSAWHVATGTARQDFSTRLTIEKFCDWAIRSQLVPTDYAAQQIFAMLDRTGDGFLTFEDFARLTVPSFEGDGLCSLWKASLRRTI